MPKIETAAWPGNAKPKAVRTVDIDSGIWVGKAEAAKLLKTSARQVERRAHEGLIGKRFLPKLANEKAPRVVYSRADIESLNAGPVDDDTSVFEWMPKAEAAKTLGVSLRMVERRVQQGYLRRRQLPRLPTESTARVVYSRADVLALKAGKPNTYARVVRDDGDYSPGEVVGEAGRAPNGKSIALARYAPRDYVGAFDKFVGTFAGLAELHAKPDLKPWLTLDEAAAYSGLTRAWLLKEAEAGQGAIAIRDMGKHARGGRWRFLRADLGRAE